jgi:nucleoside-diphosphate-sugar epimerase
LLGRPGAPGDAEGLRLSIGYIDDVVAILVRLALDGGPPCLNVAGPEVVSLRQIADAVGHAVGKQPVFDVPGVDRNLDLVADIALLQRDLGPTFTPFAEGLAHTLAEYPRADL